MKGTMNNRLYLFVILFFTCFLFVPSVFAGLLIDDFDKDYAVNYAEGKKRALFSGTVDKQSPWLRSRIVSDLRRDRVLKMTYDVADASAYLSIGVANKKIFPRYNGISFYVRGEVNNLVVQLIGSDTHEYVVEAIKEKWKQVVIPFSSLSRSQALEPHTIEEIRFVIDGSIVSERAGKCYLDDLQLVKVKRFFDKKDTYPKPTRIRKINGRSFRFRSVVAGALDLEARYREVKTRQDFLGVRFEASCDDDYWFYIGEDRVDDDALFETTWFAGAFESGEYHVRAVALYEDGGRGYGKSSSVRIKNSFSSDDLIAEVEYKSFQYFLSERHSKTGLIKDTSDPGAHFGTRANAFGILAFCIASEREYLSRIEAAQNVYNILSFFEQNAPNYAGFFPPYFDFQGKVLDAYDYGDVIATSFFIASAITAAEYFDDPDSEVEKRIREKVLYVYRRIKWRRIVLKQETRERLAARVLAREEVDGVLEGFSEGMLAYIFAIASPSSRISPASWNTWALSYTIREYNGYTILEEPSLFAHQVPHIWFDLKGLRDQYIDYYENALIATFLNREYCIKENGYEPEIWGLSTCVGPDGLKNYGAPPPLNRALNDGTITPAASLGALRVAPELAKAALVSLHTHYKEKSWGKYGVVESINPEKQYFKEFYTAQNVGSTLCHIENYRSNFVYRYFMKNKFVKNAIRRIGLK